MRITNGKDFWAGLMFMAFGLGFMIVAQNYSMGTAVRMGPAYFPTVLGGILAVLGAVIFLRSFVSRVVHPLAAFPFRVWFLIGGLILGVAAYYTQLPRDAETVSKVSHMVLSGVAVGLIFAAFGMQALWVILVSVVVFGYLLKPVGLVLAIFILMAVSTVPGFPWTRRDFQTLPLYTAAGVGLVWVTLAASPYVRQTVLAIFAAIGLNLNPTLTLIFVEFGLGAGVVFFVTRHKWPDATASQVTVLSYSLAVFSVAAFVHGLGLPMNVWPSFLE